MNPRRPERPNPADLVREARRCEAEAARWERLTRSSPELADQTIPELVHAAGRAGHWREQARRWESAARAACGPLRWAWWCRRHRFPSSWPSDGARAVAWPERAPR